MEWHRFRGVHPPACTCVDCEERRKWRLPGALRSQQPPAAPPSKPPASTEDLNRLRKTPSARSRQVPETPPAEPPAAAEDIDQLRESRLSPSDSPDDGAGSRHPIWCQCPTCRGGRGPKESPPEPPAATHDIDQLRGSRSSPSDSRDDWTGSRHPIWCQCPTCRGVRRPKEPQPEPPAATHDIDQLRGNRSSPSDSRDDWTGSRHPIWCQCPTCRGVRRPKEPQPEQPSAAGTSATPAPACGMPAEHQHRNPQAGARPTAEPIRKAEEAAQQKTTSVAADPGPVLTRDLTHAPRRGKAGARTPTNRRPRQSLVAKPLVTTLLISLTLAVGISIVVAFLVA